MRRLVVLGAGTAGTMIVNRLRKRLRRDEWSITIVDRDDVHAYQPGFLLVPFGTYRPADVLRTRHAFIRDGVELAWGEVDRVVPEESKVQLADGRQLPYDYLVIATGTSPRPDQTPGMLGEQWRRSIHEFYTYDGAVALAEKLQNWDGGRLVVHIVDMPIKCPVAPLEFAFLADAYFRHREMRDRVEVSYVTPLSGAFTKPVSSAVLGSMLDERKIGLEPDFAIDHVDAGAKTLVSYDERRIPFDLLVTVPLNMGADFVSRSGLGDELNYVQVDKHTFLSTQFDNIFAVGDAANTPGSKAGSVAHFAAEDFVENFVAHSAGQPMTSLFDGHANCYIESGDGRALLIDFNYETQPLPGRYPLPGLGPFALLHESRVNHWGKLASRWMYWNLFLPGRPVPVPAHMSMAGKTHPSAQHQEV
jgi:sulfide:quinone oxidoreductase